MQPYTDPTTGMMVFPSPTPTMPNQELMQVTPVNYTPAPTVNAAYGNTSAFTSDRYQAGAMQTGGVGFVPFAEVKVQL